ncbi:MAG: hypothetical protein GY841_05505 [FCB group bacterium]|nr:hypothetical protein [FCB group bacterium]
MAVSAPIDMEAFQDTVHQWFNTATDIETVWADQSAPQPKYPFARLKISSGPLAQTPSWSLFEETNLSRAAGTEVEQTVWVPCQFVVSIQVLVGLQDGRNPAFDALSYMQRAEAALALPSYLALFHASNMSVIRAEQTQNLTELISGSQVSRQAMDVVFGALLSATEYAGYIKTAEIQSSGFDPGIDGTFGDLS